MKFLWRFLQKPVESVTSADQLKAAELLGKHLGMFVERQEITVSEQPPVLIVPAACGTYAEFEAEVQQHLLAHKPDDTEH